MVSFCGCLEEVLVWVGSIVMKGPFGSLWRFCGLWLSWSLRRRFVGCSLGRSEVVRMVEVAGCGQIHGAFRMMSWTITYGVGPETAIIPSSASREPLTVTLATAKGAVPSATDGILTLPLGRLRLALTSPAGRWPRREKKTGFHVKHRLT